MLHWDLGVRYEFQAQMRRGVHEDDNVRLTLFKFAVYASSGRYKTILSLWAAAS